MRSGLLAAGLVLAGCGPGPDAREATVVQALVRAEEVTLRTRPALVTGKFDRMAAAPYDFFRGAVPLFRADWEAGRVSQSGFSLHTEPVLGLGDPHPENFGLLEARDGTLALEPNDFDAADRVPFLFDLRRLLIGLGVGATAAHSGFDVRPIAQATAEAYAAALLGAAPVQSARITSAVDSPILEDLFKRGARDQQSRAELSALTTLTEAGTRRFLLGPPDAAEPTQTLEPVEAEVRAALAGLLEPLDQPLLDVVREYGSGVASWPRVRLLVLLAGPTAAPEDDVIVEVKELTESPFAGWYQPAFVAADTPARVQNELRRAWAIPDADPRWFTGALLGFPVQVRTESEANKGLNTSRWVGARGTPAAVSALGVTLGALLARVHLQSDPSAVASLRAQLQRDPQVFAQEQANLAVEETRQLFEDFEHFKTARARLGPTFGLTPAEDALPTGPAAALF